MLAALEQENKPAWSALKGSQVLTLSCPANIILYHGTRGPGKTDIQLMRFRMRVGQGYGRFWRGVIFDREYKNLDDLVSKSMRWFPEIKEVESTDKAARFLSSKSDYRWIWPTGEELLFRAVKKPQDYWSYHGQEFPFIGWNELTKYPDSALYESMMSCNRSSFRPKDYPLVIDGDYYNQTGIVRVVDRSNEHAAYHELPEIPLEVMSTCNPYGVGHNWVKKKFINDGPPGKITRRSINVFNPRTQQREDVVRTQVHIFGSYKENIYLSPQYIAELESITDDNKRRAWLEGDWDVTSGGMFDDLWDTHQHVVRPFQIPPAWRIKRTYDHGSSRPFSVGWWAISDGSDVQTFDGAWKSTIRGDAFRIAEWYGTNGRTNEGLRMLTTEIAAGIIERELAMGIYGRVLPGPADNSIWDVEDGNSVAASMLKSVKINGKEYPGVSWIRSDKSPGSRKAGWEKCRGYLHAARKWHRVKGKQVYTPREKPGMFAFDTCKHFIDLFPILPRDEVDLDDVDTDAEDHIGDETRYFILGQSRGAKGGRTKGLGG